MYYRPGNDKYPTQWFRFDDEKVTKVNKTEAIIKLYSAYMLVYIQQKYISQLLTDSENIETNKNGIFANEFIKYIKQENQRKKEFQLKAEDDSKRFNFKYVCFKDLINEQQNKINKYDNKNRKNIYLNSDNEFEVSSNAMLSLWDLGIYFILYFIYF